MRSSTLQSKAFILLAVSVFFSSCQEQTPEDRMEDAVKAHIEAKKEQAEQAANKFEALQKAKFLIGSWKGPVGEGISLENWYQQDDSTLAGDGLFIKGKKTLSQETIVLTQKGNDVFYIPTVKGQNNDKPVSFKMTAATENTLMFENAEHDFPQVIKYTLYGKDSLVAEISDKKGTRKEIFAMRKTTVPSEMPK